MKRVVDTKSARLQLLQLCVAGVVMVSLPACSKVSPTTNVKNPEHVFEACKGDLKQRSAVFDEANTRANIYKQSGNRAKNCQFRRKALVAITKSVASFSTGKCSKFHDVASGYISFKVKNLQTRMVNQRTTTQAAVKQDCA